MQDRLVRVLRQRGLLAYLRVLQTSRYFLIGALATFLLLQMMILAGFGAIVAGFLLLDYDFERKLQILLIVFSTLFALPFLGLLCLFNQRLWYRVSGAQKMMNDLNPENRHD